MCLFRLEFLIAALLACSAAAIGVTELCHRQIVVEPSPNWSLTSASDAHCGGTSEASASESAEGIRLDYKLEDRCSSPYALMSVLSSEGTVHDLSWVESVRITSRSSAGSNYYRLQLRNQEPHISNCDDPTSWKYNEALIRPSQEFTTIEIARNDFAVPLWWTCKHSVPLRHALPRFDRIQAIEFTTMDRSGEGWLEVSEIELVCSVFPASIVYPLLLGLWITSFLSVLFARVVKLGRRLREENRTKARLIADQRRLAVRSERLGTMAITDPLTGLLNRWGLDKPLDAAVKAVRNGERPTSVVMFDIDEFKLLNDTMGHAHGDLILRDLGRLAQLDRKPTEEVGRWGGEEFLLICADTNLAQAISQAERLRELFESSRHGYTCSFGVYEACDGDDREAILERVDQALYDAKKAGRNRVMAYQPKEESKGPDQPEQMSVAS